MIFGVSALTSLFHLKKHQSYAAGVIVLDFQSKCDRKTWTPVETVLYMQVAF